MPKPASAQYVTANDLLTGEVIFLAPDGCWVADLSQAAVMTTPEEAAGQLARAEADSARVVGPYLAAAALPGAPETLHFRERFRATGPSNYFHGKQEHLAEHLGEHVQEHAQEHRSHV